MRNQSGLKSRLAVALLIAALAACSKKPAEPAAESEAPAPEPVAALGTAPGDPSAASQDPAGNLPGGSLSTPSSLTLGVYVTADVSNTEQHHFYKVENDLKVRDKVLLKFENQSSTLKPDVKIYDANRSLLSERYDGTPGANLDYTFTLEPGQPIFVEVLPYESTGKYKLSLTQQNAYDKYEPNAGALTAAAVKTGDDIEANILDEKDEDWYRVSGATGKTLSVTLENQSVTLKPDIKIYNADKSQVLEKYDATPGANLSFDAPSDPDKNIYIQVVPYASSGKYKLTVK